jgi:pyruvate/2-oxoacid:ferredoxin oxidoreductase alpha subunit
MICCGKRDLSEAVNIEDADIVMVAYVHHGENREKRHGESAAKGNQGRLIRPITLWPFPDRS